MLERRNPVPPGRYWLDVFSPNIADITAWKNANRDRVRVVSSESFDPVPSGTQTDTRFTPARLWLLFDVLSPVQFDQLKFGFPTVVKQSADASPGGTPVDTGVRTSEDTVDRGVDAGETSWQTLVLLVALIAGAAYIAANHRK